MATTQVTAVDADGNKVTLYESDDPPEAADINAVETKVADVETKVADQSSYDGVNIGPATDSPFSTPYNAILLASVDGDISIETGEGNDVTIPQGALTAGQPLPVTVQEVNSSGTTQTVGDIILLRE
jgi:hypothetical protein